MGTINVVSTIKLIHPSCVVMVKIGSFYSVYGKDAYLFSYLFRYKIKEKEYIPICSFPVSSLSKIENILEKHKVNYIVVDKRRNYEEEQKVINKQDNNYERVLAKANESVTFMLRIQRIYDMLLEERDNHNIDKKLKEIEKVLNSDERRKI